MCVCVCHGPGRTLNIGVPAKIGASGTNVRPGPTLGKHVVDRNRHPFKGGLGWDLVPTWAHFWSGGIVSF